MKKRNQSHDNWRTPPEFYDELNKRFKFDFDPCPYSEGEPLFDGLNCEWGQRNFVNPPYSRKLKEAFILKALEESKKGKLVLMLLPVSTSTKIFHEVILPNAFIKFIRGRLSFFSKNSKKNGKGMHDSMLVLFDEKERLNHGGGGTLGFPLGEHERLKNYEWDKSQWPKLV